ncbi:hypothetical protein ABTF44_20750, partial [Acinetobacter baumannii]
MRIVDLIVQKRNGGSHTKSEIESIVSGVTEGSIPDYQLSAWLMAVALNGMNMEETTYYTDALCRSGQVIDLSSVGPVVVD